jgi:WD40 repeat protein
VVRLCQTPAHAHLLISGGTEGHAKMWDLRDRDPVNRKYFKHAASITSLCFSPDDPHQFVVGLENGAIQRYDLRHQKNGRVWGAHGSKAVLDLQWKEGSSHVSGQGWLASAGADRTVQVSQD